MSRHTLYRASLANPQLEGGWSCEEDGALIVDNEGKITAAGPYEAMAAAHPDAQLQDHSGKWLLPGFIDCHVHLAQVFARAQPSGELLRWLDESIFPAESLFADLNHADAAASFFISECVRYGVTTAAVFLTAHPEATDHCTARMAAAGLRVITGLVQMDRDAPDALLLGASEALSATERLAAKWHGHDSGRIQYALTPRFALSCSAELMTGLGRMRREDPSLYVHTHISENLEECRIVAERFPDEPDYLGVYERFDLVGSKSHFAHAIHLTDREMDVMAQVGAGVAHCPSANFFLKSGVFPWEKMKAAGIRFGMGSDVGAGPQINPFAVMADAFKIQPHEFIDARELMWRYTLGGAIALGLDDQVGNFEVGKDADFVLLDLPGKEESAWVETRDFERAAQAMVFLGDDRVVEACFVRGRRLSPAGQVNTPPLKSLI